MNMAKKSPDWPEFLESEGELDAAALEQLNQLVQPVPVDASVRSGLLAKVEELPLRYAPFVEQLGALWRLPEAEVLAALERAAEPRAWSWTPIRGVRLLDVKVEPGRSAQLIRVQAGRRFPEHRHVGEERVLVLEGGYTDSTGQSYGPGDTQVMPEGTQHRFQVHEEGPCIAAMVYREFEFTHPILRGLQRLVGSLRKSR